MEISGKTRRRLRLQGLVFTVLFLAAIGLLAWLSTRYTVEADWTATGRNSLSTASRQVLDRLQGQVNITAFAAHSGMLPTRRRLSELLNRYRRYTDKLSYHFVNPDTAPALTRQLGITADGELVLEYQGRTQHVKAPSEEQLTNALQRLLRSSTGKLVFLGGHGERRPHGKANHDYGSWIAALESRGVAASAVNLAQSHAVAPDTDALVIAGPQVDLLPGEVALILKYVAHGGSLLWLHDPGSRHGLDPLAKALGVSFEPGVVVDPTTRLLGLANPAIALVTEYPKHAITHGLQLMSVFPQACALNAERGGDWQRTPILETAERSWTETGPLQGTIRYNAEAGEVPGPLTIGLALSRRVGKAETAHRQRVAVVCDGDFVSNTYLKNQGNEELGDRLVNWLAHDDSFINIPVQSAPDTRLALSPTAWAWIGFLFLLVMPSALLGGGLLVWWRRRRR